MSQWPFFNFANAKLISGADFYGKLSPEEQTIMRELVTHIEKEADEVDQEEEANRGEARGPRTPLHRGLQIPRASLPGRSIDWS